MRTSDDFTLRNPLDDIVIVSTYHVQLHIIFKMETSFGRKIFQASIQLVHLRLLHCNLGTVTTNEKIVTVEYSCIQNIPSN